MKLEGMHFPDDRYYAPAHSMWLREESNGEITLGLTAYGVALFGDIFAFTPKRLGLKIQADRSLGVVEFAKAAASAKSPIAGTVVAHNEALEQRPALINRDCYGEGWMIRLRPDDWETAKQLFLQGDAVVPAFTEQAEQDGFDPNDESVQALKLKS
ncbi:glycine cleavage system protein H [Denitrificimonas sp. JX-1]|uniref:Glycine cleavage system protein H n=1 Tax=Denitrificimonas halotolerans TaxID=3098930 RepID=A0ABU5GQH0_9GAMM|nr:glycine cleavage system protein H [Denitrificimonas sp. JX-1]MDY7219245.1 glycine cleavage system protein H [Denitrificimonas sp. JX-1]